MMSWSDFVTAGGGGLLAGDAGAAEPEVAPGEPGAAWANSCRETPMSTSHWSSELSSCGFGSAMPPKLIPLHFLRRYGKKEHFLVAPMSSLPGHGIDEGAMDKRPCLLALGLGLTEWTR